MATMHTLHDAIGFELNLENVAFRTLAVGPHKDGAADDDDDGLDRNDAEARRRDIVPIPIAPPPIRPPKV
jgi:hypothetical protein